MLLLPRDNFVSDKELQSVHEYLGNRRMLFLYGYIFGLPQRLDAYNVNYVTDSLFLLEDLDPVAPIYLFIDSPGGIVSSGMVLYDTIKALQSPVYTVGRTCYSMAAVLLAGGERGHRYVYPNSRVMLHLPMYESAGGQRDNYKELEIKTKELTILKDIMVSALVECGATKSRKQIEEDIDREKWLGAQETIDYGLADRIVQKGDFSFKNSFAKR